MTSSQRGIRPAKSADVARLAGVSRTTVSTILNGNGARFPTSTQQRVLDAATQLEYRPSPAGRSLASGRSDTVVVLVPHATFDGNLQAACDLIEAGTSEAGANVVVRFAAATPESTLLAITALRPLAVLNLGVLSPADYLWLEKRDVVVLPEIPSDIGAEPIDGGVAALQADALLRHGRRSIWFAGIANKRTDAFGPARFTALAAACDEHNLPAPTRVDLDLTLNNAIAALTRIVATGTPAGVACYNDMVGLALLAAARELRVDVPGEVAIIGVDNNPAGQLHSPRLTTVDVDLRELANTLALQVNALLRPTGATTHTGRPHFKLVQGETT